MAEPNDPISTMVERLDETVMTPELTIEEQVEVAIPGSLRPKEMDGSVIEVLTEEDGSAVVDFDPQPESLIDEGDFYRNRSPGRRCRRRRPSTASACRHWSSCRGYGARKVGWMFGGIQRPETARPERYAAACLAAAGPIKAVMRPRACVGVGAAIARPQRRRPGSGSAPSGDGSGRLEKLPSFHAGRRTNVSSTKMRSAS